MIQSSCRVLLASLVSPFAAVFCRTAMALGGIFVLLCSGVMCFNNVVFFIHERYPLLDHSGDPVRHDVARWWPCGLHATAPDGRPHGDHLPSHDRISLWALIVEPMRCPPEGKSIQMANRRPDAPKRRAQINRLSLHYSRRPMVHIREREDPEDRLGRGQHLESGGLSRAGS
jgi:hypothetical protein